MARQKRSGPRVLLRGEGGGEWSFMLPLSPALAGQVHAGKLTPVDDDSKRLIAAHLPRRAAADTAAVDEDGGDQKPADDGAQETTLTLDELLEKQSELLEDVSAAHVTLAEVFEEIDQEAGRLLGDITVRALLDAKVGEEKADEILAELQIAADAEISSLTAEARKLLEELVAKIPGGDSENDSEPAPVVFPRSHKELDELAAARGVTFPPPEGGRKKLTVDEKIAALEHADQTTQ